MLGRLAWLPGAEPVAKGGAARLPGHFQGVGSLYSLVVARGGTCRWGRSLSLGAGPFSLVVAGGGACSWGRALSLGAEPLRSQAVSKGGACR